MSDRAIIAIAIAPIGVYFALMGAIFALAPTHFPGPALAVGGSVLAILSAAFANVLRMRRDRKPSA
jgi:hypothetical protein